MNRTPHPHDRSLGRPVAALFSVLALLAFACFPVLAQAETVYEHESTNLPGGGDGKPPTNENNTIPHKESPSANSSQSPNSGGSELESSGTQNAASGGGNPGTPGGGGDAQGKAGNGAAGAGGNAEGKLQSLEAVPSSATSEDDSSSPLVPILIAVAVLAAISVGAVLVRQRRGTRGGFSPKAS